MAALSLGEHLKQLRMERKLTQAQVAEQLFVSRKTVSTWETGRHQPDLQTICQLATWYQITVDELIGQPSEPPKTQKHTMTFLWSAFAIMVVGRLSLAALPGMLIFTDFVLVILACLLVGRWRDWLNFYYLKGFCGMLALGLVGVAWVNIFDMAFSLQVVYMATAVTLLFPVVRKALSSAGHLLVTKFKRR
ncbi:helix-turn-helix domain-containing protein [Lacticaseibacillus casei]|uniref:Helix-turn-helix transcriptional regulator n=1 Tax=Lacticaseibacillus huelsenbergensis TaxID=3035291 RepID=A0ABY8DWS4_9LACO|nr:MULTISPECIES: helix-turn-helix transcriptional regulator [Lacticaseibacillus]MDG3062517.1 helix-turn-helix transcriptional regulator [Lacticaseibacillus sp. BCRC 81376]QVI36611.1 helix-turn-helix transcriptional regulator [Lacticaseibacillus casei]QXG58404.1 helix-turn-helix domain-containing protein [Lacticaseibacillus casei]WFB40130.1 helix-turn-helix transcriptional regulator [Lacticaseibacillus huelsenbergensis]WFB41862.1 helix-turn-helix transcriptional regulator [Lacticaseibacillus hu